GWARCDALRHPSGYRMGLGAWKTVSPAIPTDHLALSSARRNAAGAATGVALLRSFPGDARSDDAARARCPTERPRERVQADCIPTQFRRPALFRCGSGATVYQCDWPVASHWRADPDPKNADDDRTWHQAGARAA